MIRCLFIVIPTLVILPGGVQAVSPCPPGFAALQASDACVRIGGRIRAEAGLGSSRTRTFDSMTTQASGRIRMDVRKQTEYGPLRAVIAIDGVKR